MSVHPGKGGQKFIPDTIKKIEILNEYIKLNDLEIDIQVDGGINEDTVENVKKAGANIIVAGTYITNSDNFSDKINIIKNK